MELLVVAVVVVRGVELVYENDEGDESDGGVVLKGTVVVAVIVMHGVAVHWIVVCVDCAGCVHCEGLVGNVVVAR